MRHPHPWPLHSYAPGLWRHKTLAIVIVCMYICESGCRGTAGGIANELRIAVMISRGLLPGPYVIKRVAGWCCWIVCDCVYIWQYVVVWLPGSYVTMCSLAICRGLAAGIDGGCPVARCAVRSRQSTADRRPGRQLGRHLRRNEVWGLNWRRSTGLIREFCMVPTPGLHCYPALRPGLCL